MSNKKIKKSSLKKSDKSIHSVKLEYIKKSNELKQLVRTTILAIQRYKKLDKVTLERDEARATCVRLCHEASHHNYKTLTNNNIYSYNNDTNNVETNPSI